MNDLTIPPDPQSAAFFSSREDEVEFDDQVLHVDLSETSLNDKITLPEDVTRRLTGVPPQLVEAVAENPENIKPVARAMAALNLHSLYERIRNPNTTTKERLEFQNLLNKMGGLETKAGETGPSGPGFSINIVLPGHKKELTIDGTATKVVDGE